MSMFTDTYNSCPLWGQTNYQRLLCIGGAAVALYLVLWGFGGSCDTYDSNGQKVTGADGKTPVRESWLGGKYTAAAAVVGAVGAEHLAHEHKVIEKVTGCVKA